LPDTAKYIEHDSVNIGSSDKSFSNFRRGVTLSNALTAAMTYTSSDFISGGYSEIEISRPNSKVRTYKVLQSLDMRRFGVQPDPCETVQNDVLFDVTG
jgi:hypothetical protein